MSEVFETAKCGLAAYEECIKEYILEGKYKGYRPMIVDFVDNDELNEIMKRKMLKTYPRTEQLTWMSREEKERLFERK